VVKPSGIFAVTRSRLATVSAALHLIRRTILLFEYFRIFRTCLRIAVHAKEFCNVGIFLIKVEPNDRVRPSHMKNCEMGRRIKIVFVA
jgi:hypothetical protein